VENDGIFYGHLEYFTAILGPFGYAAATWYIFHRFGILRQEKSGNPARDHACACAIQCK
jgi:hypothetical protein